MTDLDQGISLSHPNIMFSNLYCKVISFYIPCGEVKLPAEDPLCTYQTTTWSMDWVVSLSETVYIQVNSGEENIQL